MYQKMIENLNVKQNTPILMNPPKLCQGRNLVLVSANIINMCGRGEASIQLTIDDEPFGFSACQQTQDEFSACNLSLAEVIEAQTDCIVNVLNCGGDSNIDLNISIINL